jgi:hypothetical protein
MCGLAAALLILIVGMLAGDTRADRMAAEEARLTAKMAPGRMSLLPEDFHQRQITPPSDVDDARRVPGRTLADLAGMPVAEAFPESKRTVYVDDIATLERVRDGLRAWQRPETQQAATEVPWPWTLPLEPGLSWSATHPPVALVGPYQPRHAAVVPAPLIGRPALGITEEFARITDAEWTPEQRALLEWCTHCTHCTDDPRPHEQCVGCSCPCAVVEAVAA